jgi:SAM-dependent methyltransferase
MEEIYRSGAYERSNPTWHDEDAPWKANQIKAILADNNILFESIGEIGCGAGGILVQLANTFPAVKFSGYDISPQAIEMATKKSQLKLNFYLKDPFQEPEAHFDIVLAIDVIEHVEDYLGFIRKLKILARFKVFHIPLDLSVQSLIRMRPILGLRRNVGHIHYFAKEIAIAALTDCGYKIVDWRYTASRLELPNQALSSRVMATPRRLLYGLNQDLCVRVLGGYSLLVIAE